jgi:hypothetical protein
MSGQKPFPTPVIEPAQVRDGLTAEAQAGAIRLMANLASHLVAQYPLPTRPEPASCRHDSPPSRSGPNISIAEP